MLQVEGLQIHAKEKYDYDYFFELLLNSPTETLSYPFIATNFPEIARDSEGLNLLVRNLNNMANHQGLKVNRVNRSSVYFGFGITENDSEKAQEDLERRCKTQATNDLTYLYETQDILNLTGQTEPSVPGKIIGDKYVCIPDIIDYGHLPKPFHVVIYDPIEEQMSLEFFSSELQFVVLKRLLETGYIDSNIAQQLGINPESFPKIIQQINELVSNHIEKPFKRAGNLVGIALNGDYEYRQEYLKGIIPELYIKHPALATKLIDEQYEGWHPSIIYREDQPNGIQLFAMHKDFLDQVPEFIDVLMHSDNPHILIIKFEFEQDLHTLILEVPDTTYELIKQLEIVVNEEKSELYLNRWDGRNSFTNGKKSLRRAIERLKSLGITLEDFEEHTLTRSRFPRIVRNHVA